MRRVAALFCCLLLCARCSEPPQKEIDRAQGAIDAARAAGAERYAAVEFSAATSALQQSHDAVDQRDYRLALSRALDASQRAQDSARQAADGQAKARSDAELAVHAAVTAVQQLESKIGGAPAPKPSDAALKAAQRTLGNEMRAVQDARSAMSAGKYPEATRAVEGTVSRISAQIEAIDEPSRVRPAKRRR